MSRFFQRFRPWVSKAAYTSAATLQMACALFLINEHVFQVRNSTGSSMLPTLAPEGDWLLHLPLPFLQFLSTIRTTFSPTPEEQEELNHPYHTRGKRIGGSSFSKADQAQGIEIKVGDLVVALSPFDPEKFVCKRVIGLPGDTICFDPRRRPLPIHAWRGRGKQQSPSTRIQRDGRGEERDSDALESKLVKIEDFLSSVGHPSSPTTNSRRFPLAVEGDVDLLKSMDTDSPSPHSSSKADTERHKTSAARELQENTYVRSKGDVQYITVPLGHVWLMGENMTNSTDSRHYGPVPLGMVKGKVLARVFPNPIWLTNNLTFVD
ncbi:related to IMP1 - protease, mitochondrial [Ustilago sp. UG-2017b]|nr:related to IMP1 - protease, mitochondrial [Ustilago sp. UG-2017b]